MLNWFITLLSDSDSSFERIFWPTSIVHPRFITRAIIRIIDTESNTTKRQYYKT